MKKDERDSILQLIDKSLKKIREGEILEGEIIRMFPGEVIVDIGFKSEARVSLSEFDNKDKLKIGDKFDFYLEKLIEGEGLVCLSKKNADTIRVWNDVTKSYYDKISIKGTIMKLVKGGCIVNVKGIEAFLPGSQLDVGEVKDMSKFVGETLDFRVIKFDKMKENIVLSRRILLEKELQQKAEVLWAEIKEEDVLEGKVKNIVDFGVFVDIGGIDGLVRIGDLGWGKITHPSEVLKIGDSVKVKVLQIDKEMKRVSIGIKQLMPYPWEDVEKKYPIASKVKGKITSLTDYGAFVELEPGVEGLIHISEMSWTRIRSPSEILTVGETVQVVVLDIDKAEEKISLGLRQTQPNPWEKIETNCPIGSIVTGVVKSFSNFGAFIELEDGIEGLLHISDLSWTEHIEHAGDVLKKRQQIKCKVLNIDSKSQRISLGLKQIEDDPLLTLKGSISSNVKGKIKEIVEKGIVVKIPVEKYKVEGFIPYSHLVQSSTQGKYNVGDELDIKLLEVDEERRRVILSEREYYESEGIEIETETTVTETAVTEIEVTPEVEVETEEKAKTEETETKTKAKVKKATKPKVKAKAKVKKTEAKTKKEVAVEKETEATEKE